MAVNPTKLFIRGGQTFLHNVRMFTQVGKKVSLAMLIIALGMVVLTFYLNTTDYQRYIGKEWVKAHALLLIQNRSKQIVKMPTGESYPVYSEQVIKAPMVLSHVNQLKTKLFISVIEACVLALLSLIFIVHWLQKKGERQSQSKIVRGSNLVAENELKKCIKKTGKTSPYRIGSVYLPFGSETQHIQIVGTTGSGKTVAIRDLLMTIRERGERAIIYDKGGTYLSRFFREDQDVLLNPLDERGHSWNVWAECEDKADLEALAEAIMPMPINNTMDPFWIHAARMIFVSTANELKNHPHRSNLMLLQYLLTTDLEKIHHLLRHTEAGSLVSEKVQKTALNVKTVMATYLKSLLYLKDDGDIFSIRDWILNDQGNSCLFVSSDGRKHPTIRPLISAWINTATKELLSLPPNDHRRVWFILDELTTMHALPFLGSVKSESRKFGGCFVLGHHGASQLRTIYGNDGATSISGLCSTRIYLRLPEDGDAEPASRNLCSYEIEEVNESISYGANTMRDGVSVSRQTREKRLVMPTEIQVLDDLEGYLRVKGNFPAAKINLNYVDYPVKHPEFIARKIDSDPLRQEVEQLVDTYTDPILASSHDTALEEASKHDEKEKKTDCLNKNARVEFDLN
ncbi:type IV conjugative transfer system coupling protein TraD [Legionella pneumophila]|uniref:type IV conjugative transfer system coupling protein TraD n=1 Tax=Legionella pneumophila TaxID=446 RepID=UPI0022B47C90|nr:type IV conjugative transfer system coupling protein TraD [Legionella pneumophila]MCZ4786734.1 type IV conjugative transfer system coupling protein TraD [Legionella pneumophila]